MNVLRQPLVYACLFVLLIAASIGSYHRFLVTRNPIPKDVRSQVNFTLYYPKEMPSGWSIDRTSFYADARDQVVGYRLRGTKGDLGITIQPVPQNFNFNDFYTKRLTSTVQFLTPLGQGAIGRASNQFVGSLVTPSSWVLASPSTPDISQVDMQYVLSHLQSISP